MITVGIDVGSISAKAALIEDNQLIGSRVILTGYNARNAGENVFNALLDELGIQSDAVDRIVATGYGRNSVDLADKAVTEITCHAAGAHFLDPAVRCVIDIGGQDSKAIALDATGRVRDFAMNDKCAAGTGRFLEVMARALEVDLDAFGRALPEGGSDRPPSAACARSLPNPKSSPSSPGASAGRTSLPASTNPSAPG
jgi:predicted CoA-substrate-specific enzyme activase